MAKKDFGRRLMPEYLLKYSEELHKNHPDPSASWGGGGGGDYTAGEGIEISDQDVISIDEEVVAKKTDIPDVSDFVTDTDLNTALADYELKSEAFSGSYNDLTDKPTLATVATTGDYDDLLNKPTIPTVPSVLSAFTNDVGYITGITSADVTTALGYTPGTSNFSGDYDDLTDKPTIPDSTSDLVNDSGFISGITSTMIANALGYTPGTSNFSGDYNDLTNKPTIPTKTSDLQNDSGFITGVTWNDVTGKPTFATVATSGSYNDLTDKPSIPSSTTKPFLGVEGSFGDMMFSQTGASGTYYASITLTDTIHVNLQALNPDFGSGLTASYNSTTKKLEVAIDTTVVALKSEIPDTTNFVTTNTNQTITGTKTFTGSIALADLFGGPSLTISNLVGLIGFSYNGRNFELPISKPASDPAGAPYTLATTDDIPSLSGYATETWVGQQGFLTSVSWNDVLNKPTFATVATSGSYNDLTDKPTIPTVPVTDVQVNGTSVLSGTVANITGVQETLVSGTNIKTINNQSILGSGNITISGSAAPYEITNMVVDSTNNTITLTITANE